ncbi:type 2 isopentenyl-diphosphate Delta-isomerase, partial [Bdellovibrionota bacterium FG-2]
MSDDLLETLAHRKREHILQAMNPKHQALGLAGLDRVHLVHEALPEIDFSSIYLSSECLGAPLATPFYVAAMTGGHPDAAALNLTIAKACESRGWAMGVGSQRADFIAGDGSAKNEWRNLRKAAPTAVFFANLGVSQLTQDFSHKTLDRLKFLVASLEAHALALHLNSLQEAIQPEGTPHFKGAFKAIERVCRELKTPVILKETGCGFSQNTLNRVRELGLAAIDVSGLGGTHWGRIEGARSSSPITQHAAETFANWG